MDFIKNNLMTLLVVAACIAGVVVYQQYFRSDVSGDAILVTDSAAAGNLDLLQSLSDLRAVKLDSAIFNDQKFLSLVDFGRSIAPEPVGRTNPFAPLGSSGGSGSNAGISPGTVQSIR